LTVVTDQKASDQGSVAGAAWRSLLVMLTAALLMPDGKVRKRVEWYRERAGIRMGI